MLTEEIIANQRNDMTSFINQIKYELKFIDTKKLNDIKKVCANSEASTKLPIDIATYNNMMDIQIKKIKSSMDKTHKELLIKSSSGNYTAPDIIGWIEMCIHTLNKELKTSFFIDYRKYRRQEKKDESGIIATNYELVYGLQKKKLMMNRDFILIAYRTLPELLKANRG